MATAADSTPSTGMHSCFQFATTISPTRRCALAIQGGVRVARPLLVWFQVYINTLPLWVIDSWTELAYVSQVAQSNSIPTIQATNQPIRSIGSDSTSLWWIRLYVNSTLIGSEQLTVFSVLANRLCFWTFLLLSLLFFLFLEKKYLCQKW